MLRRVIGLLSVLVLFASGCASTRMAPETLTQTALTEALHGETAYIHQLSGQVHKAKALHVGVDSVWYSAGENSNAWAAQGTVFKAIPTVSVSMITLTRPRDGLKASGNILGGAAAGIGLGWLVHKARSRNYDQQTSESSVGSVLNRDVSLLLMPLGGLIGVLGGAAANTPRPRMIYTIHRTMEGEVVLKQREH